MSKKMNPKDNAARIMVKDFCHYVVGLKAKHRIIKELFENQDGRKLMDHTAPAFFREINDILFKYFLLESSKITDKASSLGKENFTIAYLFENIDWPANVVIDLERLNNRVKKFSGNIKGARNKLLAHFDKNTFLSGAILGKFTKGDDEKFIAALEEMCNVFHKASFDCIFGDIIVSKTGDVLDLKKSLEEAIAFKKLFKESKGEEKQKLFNYLRDN